LRAGRRLEADGAGIAVGVVALALLELVPAIDLDVAGWFYRPGVGFPLAPLPLFRFAMAALPIAAIGGTVVAGLLAAASVPRRRSLGVTPRQAVFLALSLALGPGVLVNAVLKDHWGRARPHQILEFGGAAHFTPVLDLADQCDRNCSFPSGHGALGFWLIAFAILVPDRWKLAASILAMIIGILVGIMRIAQGAHFLSDVVAAAVLVFFVNICLKRLIIGR